MMIISKSLHSFKVAGESAVMETNIQLMGKLNIYKKSVLLYQYNLYHKAGRDYVNI